MLKIIYNKSAYLQGRGPDQVIGMPEEFLQDVIYSSLRMDYFLERGKKPILNTCIISPDFVFQHTVAYSNDL